MRRQTEHLRKMLAQAQKDTETWHKKADFFEKQLEKAGGQRGSLQSSLHGRKPSKGAAEEDKRARFVLQLFKELMAERFGTYTHEDLARTFDRMDLNHSGSITRADFERAFGGEGGPG